VPKQAARKWQKPRSIAAVSMLVRVKPIARAQKILAKVRILAKVMVSRLCPRLTVTPWADTKYHNVKNAGGYLASGSLS